MSDFNTFLWVAFPWLAIAAFVIGMIWRWRTDQFGWTTHSSQIYESKLLRLSSPLFHYGMLFVFIGHVMGLAIPKSWTQAMGISDHVYHLIATYPGVIAGIAAVLGLIGLLYRRIVNRSVFLATSASDKVMYLFLGAAILSGFFATKGTMNYGKLSDAATYHMCLEALANVGNYYALHKMVMENAWLCPVLFQSFAVYGQRGIGTELSPARDAIFYYDLGKTLADIKK